jgi:methyl-accepting chemotaxis protein
MSKSVGLKDFFFSAFNAKPVGMFISPNWIGISAFGLLGVFLNPGFLLLGAGLELAYLFGMINNPRFQQYVRGVELSKASMGRQKQFLTMINNLVPEAKTRFERLQRRCLSILDFYQKSVAVEIEIIQRHNQSLNKFLWIFLQLLSTKQLIAGLIRETNFSAEFRINIQKQIEELQKQAGDATASPELRRSLESQSDILRQRIQVLGTADEKLKYIDAELARIEQQIELLREQAAISKDSLSISNRIDDVSSSLGETTEWIKQQQEILGAVQEVIQEPPALLTS